MGAEQPSTPVGPVVEGTTPDAGETGEETGEEEDPSMLDQAKDLAEGMGGGAVVGIIIGVLAVAGAIGGGVYMFMNKDKGAADLPEDAAAAFEEGEQEGGDQEKGLLEDDRASLLGKSTNYRSHYN